jgi:myo-inositol catabolism protein IolH
MKILLDPALLADQPLERSFAAAHQFGYDGVELGNRADVIPANGPLAYSASQLKAAGAQALAAGTEIGSVAIIQPWSSPDESRRRQGVEWWKDGIHAAAELGCDRINTELSGDPNLPSQCRAAFLRSFDEILPVLEREGMEVAVEPHPWDFLETAKAALDLITEVDSPRLKYLHCFAHTFYLGGSTSEQIELAGVGLDHLHLADTFRPSRSIINPPGLDCRVHQHFDIGSGEVDWSEAKSALTAIKFDGFATVQVFCWPDRAAESFRFNRTAVDSALPGDAEIMN